MLGDALMLIVLSMWVKKLTDSNGAAGLTFLFLTLPALVAPVFGYLVDRAPRRAFLVWANLGSAAGVLPLFLVEDASDVWIIYAVAFVYGVSFVVIPAALNGLLKEMLAPDVLVEANASLSVTREALRLVGPLAGAALFAAAGGQWVAAVDAVSFVVAAVAIGTLRVTEQPPEASALHWRREMAAGVAHIRATPTLLHTTGALAIALLVFGFSESAIYAVVDAFDQPVEFVGPLVAVQGAGAIAGGLVATRMVRRWGEPRTMLLSLLCVGTGMFGVAAAVQLWQLLAAVAVLGAGIPPLIVGYNTLLQKQTPGRLMGRVTTATEVLVTTPQALSIAIGALLVTVLDYRVIMLVMTAGSMVAAAYLAGMLRGRLGPVDSVGTEPEAVAPPGRAVSPPPE
jgi:MFS family permease